MTNEIFRGTNLHLRRQIADLLDVLGSAGAPSNAQYIVGASDAVLSAERVVTSTATVEWDLATAAQAKANVPNDAITYAKMQNVSAASKLLGRGSASGSGDPEEITLGTGLSMSGTTLNSSASSPTTTEGDLIVRGSSADQRLAIADYNTKVLTADSAVSGKVAWRFPSSLRYGHSFRDDFWEAPGGNGSIWHVTTQNSAPSPSVYNPGDQYRPGILRLSTGGNAAGLVAIGSRPSGTPEAHVNRDSGVHIVQFGFYLETLSDATDDYLFAIGYGSDHGGGTNNVYARYRHSENSGKLRLICQASGSTTSVNGSTTIAAATKYVVTVVIESATSAKMYLRTYGGSDSLEATATSNIPGSHLGLWALLSKVAGTQSRHLDLDFCQYDLVLASER